MSWVGEPGRGQVNHLIRGGIVQQFGVSLLQSNLAAVNQLAVLYVCYTSLGFVMLWLRGNPKLV